MNSWEKNIRKVKPYVPGEQPGNTGIIKLNTNECPYPPSSEVGRIISEINEDRLRLYPDPDASFLVNAIAKYHGISKDNVFVGVGSDDVLAMSFITFFNSELPVIFPDITYSFYEVWAGLFKIKYKTIPLDQEFVIRKEDYILENGGIVIANPNAPTGILLGRNDLEYIIKNNEKSIVIVDEAYIDFAPEKSSAIDLVEKYDNLLIVRTFSKSRAMAGMRIGYAVGSEKLIKALLDVKFSFNSYTMNPYSIYGGAASINDEEYFRMILGRIVSAREKSKEKLKSMGFKVTDSMSNFLFVSHEKIAARDIFNCLKTKGIYVRYFDRPRIDNYLRITVGKEEEMSALYYALGKILEQ